MNDVPRRIAITLAVVGFSTALVWATSREASIECEVCMEFNGRSLCRTSSGAERDAALRGAIATACALLSNGVTAGMACDRTPPRSVSCSE